MSKKILIGRFSESFPISFNICDFLMHLKIAQLNILTSFTQTYKFVYIFHASMLQPLQSLRLY